MALNYRSENGKLARGVPKRFSEATLADLRIRMATAQSLRVGRQRELKRRLEEKRREQTVLVKSAAELGIFIPVESFE